MDNKNINPTTKFLHSACIYRIKKLKQFYENNSYSHHNNDKTEMELLKLVINECTKKKCPDGKYNLFGECLHM